MAKKSKKNKRYYYIFVAIVLIVVLVVSLLDYKFRFGIVDWEQIFPENSSTSESHGSVNVDKIGDLKITFISAHSLWCIFVDVRLVEIDAW